MAVRLAVCAAAVLALLASCVSAAGSASGSGDDSLPTDHVPLPDDGQCVVPAYSREPHNASEEDERALVLEAQCYLACIERASLPGVDDIAELVDSTDAVWPYYDITTATQATCGAYGKLQECTRGCMSWETDVHQCEGQCRGECKTECGAVRNQCSGAEYPNTNCTISCNNRLCIPGCNLYSNVVQHICGNSSCEGSPSAPSARPEVQQSPGVMTTAGVYTVNITQPSELASNGSGGFVLLYRVQDTSSGVQDFILVKDPTQLISLSNFACRELLLSFAVIDLDGISLFSPALNLTIYGDARRIPNPVQGLTVTQRADTRYGYFGHAVLDISWRAPENTKYLDSYDLQVTSENSGDNCHRGEDPDYNFDDIPTSDTSLTVMAFQRGQSLVMTCNYNIKVYSIGDDGDSVASEHVNLMEATPGIQLECSRQWDSEQYFTIVMNWLLPEYATAGGVIRSFSIDAQIVRFVNGRATGAYLAVPRSYTPIPQVNQTAYTANLVGSEDFALVPQETEQDNYRLFVYVTWGPSIASTPAISNTFCDVDATSPAPSLVEDLIIDSHSFLGSTEIQLDISWQPPRDINGVSGGYEVCVGPHPLSVAENPDSSSDSRCNNDIGSELTSTSWRRHYVAANSNCLYLQMRARNTFVSGNWSIPYIIPIDAEDVIRLNCSSQWRNGTLEIESRWSVSELSCNGVGQMEERVIVKLFLVNESYMTQLRATEFSIDDLYSNTFTGLPEQEVSSYMYKVSVEVDWIDRLTLLPEVSTASCSIAASVPKRVHPGVWASIGVCVLLATVVSLVGCLVMVQCAVNIRRKKLLRRIAADVCDDDPMYTVGARRNNTISATNALASPKTDDWEVLPAHVIVEDCLGEGAFGEVFKGVITGPISNSRVRHMVKRNAICTQVAIKLLKKSAKGSERRDFLQEIEMMKKVTEGQNPHVVSMLGCVTVQEPLCLITEFVKYGDLLSYLKANMKLYSGNGLNDQDNPYIELGNVSAVDLISFAYQIASGMEYLSSLGIVHRDLASRNILVDEGKVLKITDFGMSRETEEVYVQQSKGRVPLKWMAIESIVAREFTSASDVWAYGVALWEIGTLGGFPYPNIPNEELLSQLRRGYRMEKPENCSSEVYEIMLHCWNEDPKMRPCFSHLRSKFDSMLLEEGRDDYIILQIDADKNYYKMEPIGHITLSPKVKRKSRVSTNVEETTFTDEKPAQTQLPVSPGASPLLLHSPLASRRSHLSCSPSHEASDKPTPTAQARPLSALYPRSEQPPQKKQPVMNQYVDEPFMLAPPPMNGHAGGGGHHRRPSESASEPGTQVREHTTPEIQITVTPDN